MNRDVVISKLETKAKRKIVISDIHGNLDLYLKLLDQISYKPNEDCLILLGDLIEKGKRNALPHRQNAFAFGNTRNRGDLQRGREQYIQKRGGKSARFSGNAYDRGEHARTQGLRI